MTATVSNSTTYGKTTAIGRRPLAGVVLACALGVLQACSGADAVAPESVVAVPQSAVGAVPEVLAIETDTVVAAERFVVRGANLPTAPGAIEVRVAGQTARVMAQSSERMEVVVPRGVLPCAAVAVQPVVVRVGGRSFEYARPVRAATRVTAELGREAVALSADHAACMELVSAVHSPAPRYVVSVTNPVVGAAPARVALGAVGDGVAAGGTVGGAAGRVVASVDESQTVGTDAHARHMEAQGRALTGAPDARAAWAATRAGASFKAAVAATGKGRTVGDTVHLRALVSGCESGPMVQARVVHIGARAVVLEDVRAPRAGRMDAIYARIGEEFDAVVFPLIAREVGDPLALDAAMKGDGRVTLLFTRVVNDSMPGAAGFVSACNFHPRSTFAGSNEAALLHVRVPSAAENPNDWHRSIRSTVVHETKHLASYAERLARGHAFEEVWLEEATARVAEELYARTFVRDAGSGRVTYAESVGCEISYCDDRPVVMFKHFSALHDFLRRVDAVPAFGAGAPDAMAYASGWAFVRWVLDAQPDQRAALRALVAGSHGTGLEGVRAVAGVRVQNVAGLVADWMASLSSLLAESSTDYAGSWDVREVMDGMARQLPGAYTASPLSVTHVGFGGSRIQMHEVLPMTTHYIAVDAVSPGGSLLSLTMPSGTEVLRLALTRVR